MSTTVGGFWKEDQEVYGVWLIYNYSSGNGLWFDPRTPADFPEPIEHARYLGTVAPEDKQAFVKMVRAKGYVPNDQIEFVFNTFVATSV